MTIEMIKQKKTGTISTLAEEDKKKVMEMIDEYEFINTVLRYKSAMMPEDLVRELTLQNNAHMETIAQAMR